MHDTRERFDEEPLSTRAWTFQVRLLPRRLLTYSTALMWECAKDWCECGSGLFPDPHLANSLDFYFRSRQMYKDLLTWKVDKGRRYLYHYWNICVVAPYMDRRITRKSDCLPAISAIASKTQAATRDKYLAGLWEIDLEKSLTWSKSRWDREYCRKESHNHGGKKTTKYIASSWLLPWICFILGIMGLHNSEESQITALEVECTLEG
jgi:hypothetical protein